MTAAHAAPAVCLSDSSKSRSARVASAAVARFRRAAPGEKPKKTLEPRLPTRLRSAFAVSAEPPKACMISVGGRAGVSRSVEQGTVAPHAVDDEEAPKLGRDAELRCEGVELHFPCALKPRPIEASLAHRRRGLRYQCVPKPRLPSRSLLMYVPRVDSDRMEGRAGGCHAPRRLPLGLPRRHQSESSKVGPVQNAGRLREGVAMGVKDEERA